MARPRHVPRPGHGQRQFLARCGLGTVSGNVDDLAIGADAVALGHANCGDDAGADPGSTGDPARQAVEKGGKAQGLARRADHIPRCFLLRSDRLGPKHQRDGDPGVRTGTAGGNDFGIAKGAGDAVQLQAQLIGVDAGRGIDGEHELEIDLEFLCFGDHSRPANQEQPHRDRSDHHCARVCAQTGKGKRFCAGQLSFRGKSVSVRENNESRGDGECRAENAMDTYWKIQCR